MDTIENVKLIELLPTFRKCEQYADRLAFWDHYWAYMLQPDYEGRNDVLLYHYIRGVDSDLAARQKGILPVRSWEDLQQLPVLSLIPFTQSSAQLFVNWALKRRPGMDRAPESFETKKARFIKQYLVIPSDLDRKEYLDNERETAYAWKNNQVGNRAWRANFEMEFGIDFELLGYFAGQNKLRQQIDLARHIPTFDLQMNWVVIDTYLFAQAQYEYAVFLERFDSSSASTHFSESDSLARPRRLTQRQRVLIYCYQQNSPVTRAIGKELAIAWGFKSGEAIYQDYVIFATPKARLSYSGSKREARRLIRDIESIIGELTTPQRQQAENEIQTIASRFEIEMAL